MAKTAMMRLQVQNIFFLCFFLAWMEFLRGVWSSISWKVRKVIRLVCGSGKCWFYMDFVWSVWLVLYIVPVWIQLIMFTCVFPFFFFLAFVDFSTVNSALFTDPQILFFNNFFIKNGSHRTIHTFKNYFAIVFSVFSFSKISSIQTDP